jgi:cyanophycin synthetase
MATSPRPADEAVEHAQEIGFPVILKPLDLSHGRGISPRLTDEEAVRDAVAARERILRAADRRAVAEGRDHRVLVIGGKLVAVAERVPAHVTGDGEHTVRQLIDIANEDPRRGIGHTKVLTRLECDETTVEFLARSGLTLDSVPATARRSSSAPPQTSRPAARRSTAPTRSIRATSRHVRWPPASWPRHRGHRRHHAGHLGSVPRERRGDHRGERGARRAHAHAPDGRRAAQRRCADHRHALPARLPDDHSRARDHGTNGKTTTVRLVAHIFRHTGKNVGFTTTDGVYFNNRLVIHGDMTGPFSANIISRIRRWTSPCSRPRAAASCARDWDSTSATSASCLQRRARTTSPRGHQHDRAARQT